MKLLTSIALALIVGLAGTVGFVYSGIYDVSASASHSGIVTWLLSTTSHASIERRADEIDVPALDNDTLFRSGAKDFSAMCAGCHGAPGLQPDDLGQGLNPTPPDLAESAEHMTPAELFWVTKHGIKMTGMPAWGTTHEDEALWPVVAFMTTLPGLDAMEYQTLLANTADLEHEVSDHKTSAISQDHSQDREAHHDDQNH